MLRKCQNPQNHVAVEYISKAISNIDVPCYHLNPDADQRALATENNEWEDSDPKALYQWFTTAFDDALRDRVRRFISYIKAWAALNLDGAETDQPSSVLLTVLVADACLELDDDVLSPDDEGFAQIVAGVAGCGIKRQRRSKPGSFQRKSCGEAK